MKVSDVMHRSVITVTEDVLLKEAGRLIFSLGLSGIPVVKGSKLVGIVTEEDILAKMHPTLQDLVDDYIHAKDFDTMAKSIHGILEIPVGKSMNTRVMTIAPDAPLMQAHSEMQMNKFSRLPVVNEKNELVGIISQGDIFRAIIREEIPQLEQERYAGFISQYYDQMVNWNKRFDEEFPTLFELFEKKNVKKILDLGVWTGEYTVGLANRSKYSILGIDNNPIMIRMSNEKKAKLPKVVRNRLSFSLVDYKDLRSLSENKFNAIICMGNSFPYISVDPENLLKGLSGVMSNNALMVIQLLNFEKILKSKNRLLNFGVHKENNKEGREQLSIEFFDRKDESNLLHNTVIFDYDGINWVYKGITTIEVRNIKKGDLKHAFKKAGFKNVSFFGNAGEYQGEFGKLSLETPFDPINSDWMTVVAER
jgi:CBS domain-containing protein